jgi:hypothetical protein
MGGAGIYEIRRGKSEVVIRSDTVPRIPQMTIITEFARQPAAYIDIPEPD